MSRRHRHVAVVCRLYGRRSGRRAGRTRSNQQRARHRSRPRHYPCWQRPHRCSRRRSHHPSSDCGPSLCWPDDSFVHDRRRLPRRTRQLLRMRVPSTGRQPGDGRLLWRESHLRLGSLRPSRAALHRRPLRRRVGQRSLGMRGGDRSLPVFNGSRQLPLGAVRLTAAAPTVRARELLPNLGAIQAGPGSAHEHHRGGSG